MIRAVSPFVLPEQAAEHFLLEDHFQPQFSLRQKAYYAFLRPLIPLWLRRQIQAQHVPAVHPHHNFINAEFINLVLSVQENRSRLERNYPSPFTGSVVLTHDVDTEPGFRNIPLVFEIEQRLGMKSSWNIVPYKYKVDPGIIRLLQDSGHEIGIHGYNHDGKLYYSKKIFDQRVPLINRAIREYHAVGFRSPMVHRNLQWLQQLDIEYDGSCFDNDPYQPFPGGTGSIWPFVAGKFVELPYTMPQDHTLFYVLGVKDISVWKTKAEWISQNHGVILTLTHPDYLNTEEHLRVYTELLELLRGIPNQWFCLPRELASWWRQKYDDVPKRVAVDTALLL